MSKLAADYLAAMRLHGEEGHAADLLMARKLGETAVQLDMGILEFAKIQEAALKTILSSPTRVANEKALTHKTAIFFNEAIIPIEERHRCTMEATEELPGTHSDLDQLIRDLTLSRLQLARKNEERKLAEEALHSSERNSSQLLKKSRVLQEELRLLPRRLLSVQEEDRKRISRELHDLIAQTLTSTSLQLALFKSKAIGNSKGFHRKIEQTQQLIEKSVETVHRFARNLRPAILDDLGLIPALQSHLKNLMEDTGIRVSLTALSEVEKLSNENKSTLYRVALEALSNVAEHAKASHAEVKIHQCQEKVRMEIHDNGNGFRVDVDAFFGEQSERLGLLGMKERVEMMKGRFHIESAPGQGTTVCAEIPHKAPNARQTFL